jgi:hypothetical protein
MSQAMNESLEQPPPQQERRFNALIDAYQAHRANLRKEAQALADLRQKVLDAADEDAQKIATAMREEVHAVLVRAQQDLLALAEQVEMATEAINPSALFQDVAMLAPSAADLRTRESVKNTHQQLRGVLDEVKPEFEAVLSELDTLRLRLRQPGDREPSPAPPHEKAKIAIWDPMELGRPGRIEEERQAHRTPRTADTVE